MKFVTHKDPFYDLGGKSNVQRKPRIWRWLVSATRCAIFGHKMHGTGHANGDRYSSYEWQIGSYYSCKNCQARVFELKDAKQFEEVMFRENRRWTEYFAEKRRAEKSAKAA